MKIRSKFKKKIILFMSPIIVYVGIFCFAIKTGNEGSSTYVKL